MKDYSDIYSNRRLWNKILLFIALLIISFSLIYTYNLYKNLQAQEKSKVEDIATAYNVLLNSTDQLFINQALEIVKKNNYIPILWVDQNNTVLDSKNIDSAKLSQNYINDFIKKSNHNKQFVEILNDDSKQYLYYSDSNVLRKLKIFPIIQILLVGIFIFIAYRTFRTTQLAEKNQLWVGMAKETAHQLGTPISSLNAWIEILKDKLADEDKYISDELTKDFNRLEIVADRFSKIGSITALQEEDLANIINEMMDYYSKRASKNIQFTFDDMTKGAATAYINKSLIEWVLENLFKNALDAIEGSGTIHIILTKTISNHIIDVIDSGKGIPKNMWKEVFEPGFSTKKRGWGLGLTLVKRIVEEYHKGKVEVLQSVIGKGTTFRVTLQR